MVRTLHFGHGDERTRPSPHRHPTALLNDKDSNLCSVYVLVVLRHSKLDLFLEREGVFFVKKNLSI